jgi:hypothetical protein
MNLSYEKMLQLASAGLKASGIGEKAALSPMPAAFKPAIAN